MDVTQATGGHVYGVQTQLTPAISLDDENYSQA